MNTKYFLRRLPFVLKVVLLTVLAGTLVSLITDHFADRVVKNMFQDHLKGMLERQSQEDRLRFDHYLKDFHQVARLTAQYRPLLTYLDNLDWRSPVRKDQIIRRNRLPPWLLNRQALSDLATPRYVVLLDDREKVREIHLKRPTAQLPEAFLDLPPLLIEKSRGQTHIFSSGQSTYAITGEDVFSKNTKKATLLLISPIDDEFLIATQRDMPGRLIGLVDVENNTLLSSNSTKLLPGQISLEKLKKDFVITGREYHDYGGAEMAIRLSSFLPREEMAAMSRKFIKAERRERLFTATIYFLVFILITLWITKRIKDLTTRVNQFSQQALGGKNPSLPSGDQLDILNERFQVLTEEILSAQRTIKEIAEEEAARKVEYETSSRQLILLELIMEALGFGVLVKKGPDYHAVNNKMMSYLEICQDISDFLVKPQESLTKRIKDENGKVYIFQLTGLDLFDESPVIVVNDITETMTIMEERNQLQENLHQAMKMESIGRLAGGIAHDFNNLLTAILGYAQLGIIKSDQNDPQKTNFENIFEAGNRASDMTQQLLSFSRKQKLRPQTIEINTILSNLQKLFNRLIGENILIETVMGENLWMTTADRTQIEQMLMNLAINAKDAMPGGGKIVFETSNFETPVTVIEKHKQVDPGRYVRLTVTDTGTGIAEEDLDHVFEPFFTTKDIGKGTGLGLAMVYGIVKQNHGSIFVKSALGQGTTFEIYLPASEEKAVTRQQNSDLSLTGGKETVLLVEDDDQVKKLVEGVLASLGYKVYSAKSSEEAAAVAAECEGRLDLLFTDIIMPGMNGIELAASISKSRPLLKVLFMTGYSDKEITKKLGLTGDENILNKPLTPISIAQKVREVLDN